MTEQQKTDWIFTQAREEKRQEFLDNLTGSNPLQPELSPEEILEWCEEVEDREIYLDAADEEYWPDGAWDSEIVTTYSDPFGIADFLIDAFRACRQMMLLAEYEQAYRCLERICSLEFQTEYDEDNSFGWVEDGDGLSLEQLNEENLLTIRFDKLSRMLLYCCYQSLTGSERMERLYGHFMQRVCKGAVMTDVFAYGPEPLVNTEQFMEEWCIFLMEKADSRAAELAADGKGECRDASISVQGVLPAEAG